MNQNERRVSQGPRRLSSHRAAGRGAGADFAWPPSDEDLSTCGVILLEGDGPHTAELRVVVHLPDVLAPPVSPAPRPRRQSIPPVAHGPRFRHWGVEQADYPFHVESDKPARDSSSAGEAWRAVLALAAGLSLAVLSYAQFRGARGELPVPELTAALTPAVTVDTPAVERAVDAEAALDILAPVAVAAPSSAPDERERGEGRGGALASARPALARLAASVLEEAPRLEALAASAMPTVIESADPPAVVAPPPTAIDVEEAAAVAEATAMSADYVDPTPGDEDRIRAALTRWRMAYSALDASAARDVWPSVDTRALERAFQALKSQELLFDRCHLTVNGGSAQAACTGRAVYVPRVGKQSPRATPREWTFELKKSDQRWTIASARSS